MYYGVNTNGAAAKVMHFDSSLKGEPKGSPRSKNVKVAATPLVLTPFVPFRGPPATWEAPRSSRANP